MTRNIYFIGLFLIISCTNQNIDEHKYIKEKEINKTSIKDSNKVKDDYFKGSGLLSGYKIKKYIPNNIIDTTFTVFKNLSSSDSINLSRLMRLNFEHVLQDTSYHLLDSLNELYNYEFPIDKLGYFNKISIKLSKELDFHFSYTRGFKYMSDSLLNYDNKEMILKNIKNERYDRVSAEFHNQLVFSVEFDMFKDSLLLYLPYCLTAEPAVPVR